jgi:hypothetical protein
MPHSTPNQVPRQTEQSLQRRITLTLLVGVAAGVFWLIPIVLLAVDGLPDGVLVLLVGVAMTASICSTVAGVVLRFQRAQLRRANEDRQVTLGSHEHVVRVLVENQLVLQQELTALRGYASEIAGKMRRDYWQIYSEAQIDMQGGPEAVAGTETRAMNTGKVGAVVPLCRVNGRG